MIRLRSFIAAALSRRGGDDNLEDLALIVDCAPKVAELAVDLHEHLIQVPAPLRIAAHGRDPLLSDLGGEHRTKPVPPEPDGLVADVDPALGQQIRDVRSDRGYRTYIITISRMTSGELLKYRNGLLMR